jgi:hypothetical protein
MIDHAVNKVLPGCHRSGVSIPIRDCIGGRRLVGVGARHGTSTGKVSPITTIETPPIRRVLHWPLNGLLLLHILTSRGSRLGDIGELYELALQSLVALHGSLGSLLELSSGLLLGSTLDWSGRWHTYPKPGVAATLTLSLLLPFVIHDTTTVLKHQCLVHHALEIPKISGL